MAEISVNNEAGTKVGAMAQTYSQAVDGGQNPAAVDGKHVHGADGAGLDTDVARQLSEGLIKTPFDDVVVVGGFSGAYINAMSRELGSRQIKSMRYGYYSVGLRQITDTLAAQVTLTAVQADRKAPDRVSITVTDASLFDVTDVITFDGVAGYVKTDAGLIKKEMIDLAARVCAVNSADNVLTVQFLNGMKYTAATSYASHTEYNTAKSTNLSADEFAALSADKKVKTAATGTLIPADTTIYILGHAACEIDASTTPYAALPERKEQFMQKFMVQSLVSTVEEESEKEVKWGKAEIDNLLMQQFLEDIEKAYLKGVKSYTFDKVTKLWTYTTSGVIEQLIEGGGVVKVIEKSQFNEETLLDMMTEIFIGNNGSEKRYMLTGIEFAKMFFKIDDIDKYYDTNSTERKFEYDWTRLRFFNYIVNNAPDPLFDRLGMRNCALVLDRQYVERRFFRSMDETELLLKETGKYDGKSTVWSEISSVILKYPQCHALIKVVDDAE